MRGAVGDAFDEDNVEGRLVGAVVEVDDVGVGGAVAAELGIVGVANVRAAVHVKDVRPLEVIGRAEPAILGHRLQVAADGRDHGSAVRRADAGRPGDIHGHISGHGEGHGSLVRFVIATGLALSQRAGAMHIATAFPGQVATSRAFQRWAKMDAELLSLRARRHFSEPPCVSRGSQIPRLPVLLPKRRIKLRQFAQPAEVVAPMPLTPAVGVDGADAHNVTCTVKPLGGVEVPQHAGVEV